MRLTLSHRCPPLDEPEADGLWAHSGFDNTTSGILGYSVIGHEWVSDITTLFYGGTTKDGVSSIYDTSGDIFFVANIPVSVNGRIVFGFTDLVLYTVDNDLVNDSMPATTTDLIVAPKYDLILWEDAQMCTFSDRWFITKDIIALPVYEVAVWPWDLSNVVSLWQDPRLDYRTVLLDSDPVPAETASASLGKNAAGRLSGVTRLVRQGSKGTLGMWSVRLAVRALTLALGLGLYLLVVGAMLWSTLAASWYYTGIGDGVSLAALEAAILGWNYFSVSAIVICSVKSMLTWRPSVACSSRILFGTKRTYRLYRSILNRRRPF